MADASASELSSSVMPVTTGRSEQVAIRLPHDHIARTRRIRDELSRPGLEPPTTSEVMRAIFAKGLEGWERELGIKTRSGKSSRAKR